MLSTLTNGSVALDEKITEGKSVVAKITAVPATFHMLLRQIASGIFFGVGSNDYVINIITTFTFKIAFTHSN